MSNFDVSTIHLSFADKAALSYVKIRGKVKVDDIETHPHYLNLENKGLIHQILIENGTRRPTHTHKYEISKIGWDYIYFRHENRFDSVFTPIIVTILTTIVMNLLKLLLSLIL